MILPKIRDPRFITVRRGGTLQDDDHRLLAVWAADCAEHVLHHFEQARPKDDRPRRAIDLGRAWARGEIPWSEARTAAGHANAAARDLRGAARHAAYAAGQAAAVGHVAAHELGAAAYAIRAVRAAAPEDEGEAAGRLECQWQRDQLPHEIRDLVLDDQRLRNELCWFAFDVGNDTIKVSRRRLPALSPATGTRSATRPCYAPANRAADRMGRPPGLARMRRRWRVLLAHLSPPSARYRGARRSPRHTVRRGRLRRQPAATRSRARPLRPGRGDAYGDPNLQPPYQLHMIFRPSGDEARLDVTGTGWGATRFSMSGPGKALDRMIGDGTDDGGNLNNPGSYIMPAVGTWHFRFADDHCIREFDVEVLPKV